MSNHQGRVIFEGALPARALGGERFIRVYLPPTYETSTSERFPVLYVHDGQNAFSTVGDHVAFGWGNWQLDLTANRLASSGEMQPAILVGIDCGVHRYSEYKGPSYPSRPIAETARRPRTTPRANRFLAYQSFVIDELKPWIDQTYRSNPGPATTGLLGSSMGGICSLALAWQRPDVFGLAASLSGAFQVERRAFIAKSLKRFRGKPKPFRVYLDSGIIDYSGGDDGCKDTEAVVRELKRIGWRNGEDLLHFVDRTPLTPNELAATGLAQSKWAEAQTSQHNEFYWRLRAWRALTFLFPGRQSIPTK